MTHKKGTTNNSQKTTLNEIPGQEAAGPAVSKPKASAVGHGADLLMILKEVQGMGRVEGNKPFLVLILSEFFFFLL